MNFTSELPVYAYRRCKILFRIIPAFMSDHAKPVLNATTERPNVNNWVLRILNYLYFVIKFKRIESYGCYAQGMFNYTCLVFYSGSTVNIISVAAVGG